MRPKQTPEESQSEAASLLPLPEPVTSHHLRALTPQMEQWQAQKRLPATLLFTGTSGIGKRAFVHFLAQWIFCEKTGFTAASLRPCGNCNACQKALRGSWVDFTEILPEKEGSGQLKIDQFREVKSKLGFGAHEGSYRIVSIPNADRMTVQAANSVLKLLEEPPPGWLFFLTASDPSLILPTILSRCQRVSLHPFAEAELEKILSLSGVKPGEGDADPRRKLYARLAQGSWERALSFLNEGIWEKRRSVIDFLEQPSAFVSTLVDWGSQDNAALGALIDQLESFCSDLIRWSLTATKPESRSWENTDAKDALAAHAQRVSAALGSATRAREFWIERAERLARARGEMQAPLNKKNLLQDILLPWLAP